MGSLRVDVKEILKPLWLEPNSPASFSGASTLYKEARKRKVKVTLKQVQDFLRSQKTYTIHHAAKIRFPKASLIAYSLDYSWQADTAYMVKFWR